MDKYDKVTFLLVMGAISIGVVCALSIGFAIVNSDKNSPIIAEGEVIEFEIRPSGGWVGGNDYMIKLDNQKWYEIAKTYYYEVEIGDYIVIYESNRVEVIDNQSA